MIETIDLTKKYGDFFALESLNLKLEKGDLFGFIGPNGTVQSLRLANAQISYRGTGDLAAASKPGWGTSALLKLWPF